MENLKNLLLVAIGGYVVFYFLEHKNSMERELVSSAQKIVQDSAKSDQAIINRIAKGDYSDVE